MFLSVIWYVRIRQKQEGNKEREGERKNTNGKNEKESRKIRYIIRRSSCQVPKHTHTNTARQIFPLFRSLRLNHSTFRPGTAFISCSLGSLGPWRHRGEFPPLEKGGNVQETSFLSSEQLVSRRESLKSRGTSHNILSSFWRIFWYVLSQFARFLGWGI